MAWTQCGLDYDSSRGVIETASRLIEDRDRIIERLKYENQKLEQMREIRYISVTPPNTIDEEPSKKPKKDK